MHVLIGSERAEVEDHAFLATRLRQTRLLAVEHEDFVVVVDLLGGPVRGELGFEHGVARADGQARRDQAEAPGVTVAVWRSTDRAETADPIPAAG